jgi:hypothetical protein
VAQISGRLDQKEQSYLTFNFVSQITFENNFFSVFSLKILKAKFGYKYNEKINFFCCFHTSEQPTIKWQNYILAKLIYIFWSFLCAKPLCDPRILK